MNTRIVTFFVSILVVTVAVGFFLSESQPMSEESRTSDTHDEIATMVTYRDETYGLEIVHPSSWYAYGTIGDFSSNENLLNWRGFVPNFDPNKSMEEQDLFSIQVYKKNMESSFDAPRRYLVQDRVDELWEKVTVNGYLATKITNTTSNTVTDYIFERREKVYALSASNPDLFEIILPTLKFF